jgi:hypothetical protein
MITYLGALLGGDWFVPGYHCGHALKSESCHRVWYSEIELRRR